MADPTPLVILGTGGNCLDILEIALDINAAAGRTVWECVGFLDDAEARRGERFAGLPVLGPLLAARDMEGCRFVNGIGSSATFRRKEAVVRSTGVGDDRFATLVHPTAVVARSASLGAGCVLFPHVSVFSRAHVGAHTLVLAGTVINHDAHVGAFGSVTSGVLVSGGVRIGEACYLGTGCAVRDGVSVGAGSLVGMGATVVADAPAGVVVAGTPARVVRPLSDD